MPAEAERGRDRALVHDPVAGELGVLLVQGDVAAAEPLVLERAAHHPGAGDRQPVVGEADRAGLAQLDHLGQLLALHAAGDGGEEADRDRGAGARLLAQRVDVGGGRDRRLGVGHRQDPAVAAGGGGAGAGLDVLFVLVAGGAEVDVGVEEGGEGVQALGLDHLGAVGVGLAGRRQLGDLAVADDDVVDAVDPGDRVEHGRPAQDQVRRPRRRGRRASRSRLTPAARSGSGCGSPSPSLTGGRALAAGEQLVEDRHPHDQAGGDLLGDQRLRRVDRLAGELDAAVDRPGVHQQLARAEAAGVDLEVGGVLAQRGDEALAHPLVLHPQRVDDVGLLEPVERVRDLAAELLDPARDQGRRAADGDLGAHPLEGDQVGAGDAAVEDVADDPDPLALERCRGGGAGCRRRAAPGSGARACRRRR